MKTFKETIVAIALVIPVLALSSNAAKAADANDSFSSYSLFSETIRGLNGIHFDGKLGLGYAKDIWMTPIESDEGAKKKMISKNGNMALEFNGLDEYRDEVITWNKKGDAHSAAVTVFKDKRPESHTFVVGGEGFTINANVCEILRSQTGSKTMSDLAARAKSCNEFYKTNKIPAKVFETLKDLEQVHSSNIQRLRTSVAKDAFPKTSTPDKKGTDDLGEWIANFMATAQSRSEKPKAMPRQAKDIFSAKMFGDGSSYRDALAGVSDACARFYPSAVAPAPAARPGGAASGAATSK